MSAPDLKKLAAPFRESDYEWRIAQCGVKRDGEVWAKVLCYVTARAVMDRLDEVVGPENWKVSYTHEEGGVMAHLAIRCGDEWVEKSDGAQKTDIESFKGGISGALKRAAVTWGIGRLLYNLPEHWADCSKDPRAYPHWAKTKEGTAFSWRPPFLAKEAPWAVAGGDEAPQNGNGQGYEEKERRAIQAVERHEEELSLEGHTAPLTFPGAEVSSIGDLQAEYTDLAKKLYQHGFDVREKGYTQGDSQRVGAAVLEERIVQMKQWLREVV